jgi:hypothetical protein
MGADPSLCFRADPEPKPGTHIFVVGVSRYRHARDGAAPTPFESYGIGQLTTAASSAAKVAAWFRTRFCNPVAPIASIRLLLSPHATEEQTIATLWGGLPPPAMKREVATALHLWQRDLNSDRSSIGVLYGVGHGLAADPETPVLLLEDFAAEPRVFGHSFNVGHAHRALGETAASRQFFLPIYASRRLNDTG